MFHFVANWLIHHCIEMPCTLMAYSFPPAFERAVCSLCFLNQPFDVAALLRPTAVSLL